ncbi:MAG: hypothetical protein AMS22_04380 [Thiotrichales bacterium SG8_50]|nr:MAG: hypothetical protein AMS22_04380 [Thiotrichales bacterium SG8_50]
MQSNSANPLAGLGVVPDYGGTGITNLMASVSTALGADSPYAPLGTLPPAKLAARAHIVLVVIDGLGEAFLSARGPCFLGEQPRQRLTSVFPSTTASAMTTYYTAVAPQQHAITGWFTYLRELGSVAAVLPFVPRHGGEPFSASGIGPGDIIASPVLAARVNTRHQHMVTASYIADSDFTLATAAGARRHPYEDLAGFCEAIAKVVTQTPAPSYTLAYWPQLDSLAHRFGVASQNVAEHFAAIDAALAQLSRRLAGHDCIVLVSADHGLVDTDEQHLIEVEAHRPLHDALVLPLCGEPRAAYCYVHANKQSQFEDYVHSALGHCCDVVSSERLINDGLFGQGPAASQLAERVGHYVLLMRAPYIIKDRLANERPFHQIGVHGGLSEREMWVPLIRIAG